MESPSDMCSSPTEEQTATPKAAVAQQESEVMMDSPTTSPTSTSATTAPEPNTPDNTKVQNTSSASSFTNHKASASAGSSRSSSTTHLAPKPFQQQQHQSGDYTVRRRQGTSSHRGSSFEYKETLDATTKHLEDGSRIINQYKLFKMIGQGAYGSVYEACQIHDPSQKFAIKEFGKTRLRKNHRAANMRKVQGRGGFRGRIGFAARGARGGKEGQGVQGVNSRGEEAELSTKDGEMESAAMKLSKMTIKDEKDSKASPFPFSKPKDGGEQDSEKSGDPLSLIRHEIAILKKLSHPNMVELYEVLDDPSKDGLYMVFEYCQDGRVIDVKLHEQVEPLDEETARDYLVQIMLGIEYLHHNDIVHRDIKPDNILLQDNRKLCKIVDFGVSEMFTKPGDDTLNKSAGSPAFMSPELCTARHGDFHGKYSDVWSLGVTFYCMVVGRLPFDKSQFLELYEAITKEEPDYPSHLSKNCKHLLQRLMTKDPNKRITLAEMRQDPFITRNGEVEIMSEEENTSSVVVEVTDEEVDGAIKKIASVFVLARAISKFKRAGSRASSSSSIGEITNHWLQKGKDMASMPESEKGMTIEGEEKGEEEPSPSMEHVAAAHIALGASSTANAAKNLASSVFEKGHGMMTSPDQVDSSSSQGKEQKKNGAPDDGQKSDYGSYFGKEGASRAKEVTKEEKKSEKDEKNNGLLGQTQVSSPLSEDFPNPAGASAAYNGRSTEEEWEENQR